MTDDEQTLQETDAVAAAEADDTGTTVVGAVAADGEVQAVGKVVTDYDNAVIVAAFAEEGAALAVYESLKRAESASGLGIEGVLVVKTDQHGMVEIQKMTDHSTKTGAKWGAVGGVVLGIFFPPAIIAATVGTAVVGGILGKVRQEWHKSEAGAAFKGTLGPNESGILALVSAGDVEAVKAEMPGASKIRSAGVDEATARSIKDAAAQAGDRVGRVAVEEEPEVQPDPEALPPRGPGRAT